jgi:hypothetical protein
MARVALKRPGVIRIGVSRYREQDGPNPDSVLRRRDGCVRDIPYEALLLVGAHRPTSIAMRYRKRNFVITSDIELKSGKFGKVGGMLKKVSGDKTPGGSARRAGFQALRVGERSGSPRTPRPSSGGDLACPRPRGDVRRFMA